MLYATGWEFVKLVLLALGDDELEFYRVLEEPVQELRAFFLARAHSGSFFSNLVPGSARKLVSFARNKNLFK
jgi:hypothetical protein